MRYCTHCGAKIEDNEICKCQSTPTQPLIKQLNPKRITIFAGIAAVMILIIVIVSVSSGRSSSNAIALDPFDYVEVSFEGIQSQGTVHVDFDKEAFVDQLMGEKPDIEDPNKTENWLIQYGMYYDGITYTVLPVAELSNGDTVTVTFSTDENIAEKVKCGSKVYTVSGLKEVTTVDLFADIGVVYTGVSGNATAMIKILNESSFVKECDYSIDRTENLTTGDTITVTISSVSIASLLENHNVAPKEISKVYMVDGLSEYVTSADQLPTETLEEFTTRFLAKVEAGNKPDFLFSYGPVTHYGTYFMTLKESETVGYRNILKIVVSYEEYLYGEYHRTIYTPLEFYNIVINHDGSVDLTYEQGNSSTFNTNIEDNLRQFEGKYHIEKNE